MTRMTRRGHQYVSRDGRWNVRCMNEGGSRLNSGVWRLTDTTDGWWRTTRTYAEAKRFIEAIEAREQAQAGVVHFARGVMPVACGGAQGFADTLTNAVERVTCATCKAAL